MAELLQGLTDDQLALLGCVGSLLGAMLLLSLSFHAGSGMRSGTGSVPINHAESDESREQRRQAA